MLLAKDTLKFAVLVGLGGIFFDASIAHGLFWDNDPYWTYWITKTFLITSVFLFGTAFLGIGIWQGVVLTAVHTLILEIYYQWLAPIGLPQEPEWLDFNHLWVTGVPAHYLSIFAGYLLALWLWRRNYPEVPPEKADTGTFALYALVTAAIIIALDGIITQLILLRDFPGITFFVQHLLIGFVFVAAWTAYAGLGISSWIVGSMMLALVWVSYNMYLGPRGLPLEPPYFSGYADLWWKSFPGAFVSALIGWWVSGWVFKNRRFLHGAGATAAMLVLLAWPGDLSAQQQAPIVKGTNALHAAASASGEAMRVTGPDPVNVKSTIPAEGSISVETWESGNRWSHVQNTDAMKVRAEFSSDEGNYEVTIDKPMPRHPLGRYTTWNGVVYDHEMHGDTGIGTGKLPKMRPEIALWGWAVVKRDGKVISPMAPAHVMVTSSGPVPGIMLEIDTEEKTLAVAPDGYINVMWHKIDSLQMPSRPWWMRTIVGWIGLIGVVALFGFLALREPQTRVRRT
jgi:hypothetical protein